MMQSEFERRIGHPIPPTEWPTINRIYAYHPDVNDVGGEDQIAQLYTTYGFRGTLPVLILALLTQRYVVKGLTAGAVKG